jgi:4-diphosphocytidyl-2-C-methyl-D-erythritol kinase
MLRGRSDGGALLTVSGLALGAPAKVNLALHVTGRRPDGYHLLDSIAVFAEIGDTVELAPGGCLSLAVSGPFAAHAPGDATDLAWRAAEAFFARTGRPSQITIRIEKNLPAGAGLGGGSADAAAVLAGLNGMFGTPLPAAELSALGLGLGADVPMCLAGKALRARGIGERVEPLAGWPALPLVLVWPGRPVSTAACFAALAERENPPLPHPATAVEPADVAAWLAGCRNDLEPPALGLAGDIGEVLTALRATPGCLLARMSGSGSACFGLYGSEAASSAGANQLRADRPDWWVTATNAS